MENKKIKVAVLQCETYETDVLMQKLNAGAELLGGWERWLKPGMNVLLKVNLIGPLPSESAAVTHAEFVRALIRILKAHGCNAEVGDSAGGAIGGKAQTGKSFEVSGIAKVAAEEGAKIRNFDTEGVVETENYKGEKMLLAKPVFDADLVINLPKLKTHLAATYTGAVKNLFGCVPGQKKAAYHKAAQTTSKLGEVLCCINEAVKPGLHIMDGILAMDRQGPTAGGVYKADKILMGADPLALDAVAVRMIGLDIAALPFFRMSIERGIGVWDLEKIEIIGDFDAPPALKGFRLPRVMMGESERGGALGKMIDFMRTRPEVDLKKCKKCNVCVDNCPMQAIDKKTKQIDYQKCIECMCCHELCMHKAVKLVHTNPVMRVLSGFRKG